MGEAEDQAALVRLLRSGDARRIRREAGVKVSAIAADMGVTLSTVYRWEKPDKPGERRIIPSRHHAGPYLKLLRKLEGREP